MEMEMEVKDELMASAAELPLTERLAAAAERLELAAERLTSHDFAAASGREAELERLLAEAEGTIAALKSSRKTVPVSGATLLAKEGQVLEAGALDTALSSLSLEQRFAVKAQLLRSGLLG